MYGAKSRQTPAKAPCNCLQLQQPAILRTKAPAAKFSQQDSPASFIAPHTAHDSCPDIYAGIFRAPATSRVQMTPRIQFVCAAEFAQSQYRLQLLAGRYCDRVQ